MSRCSATPAHEPASMCCAKEPPRYSSHSRRSSTASAADADSADDADGADVGEGEDAGAGAEAGAGADEGAGDEDEDDDAMCAAREHVRGLASQCLRLTS